MDNADALALCDEVDKLRDEWLQKASAAKATYVCVDAAPRLAAAVRELVREREELEGALREIRMRTPDYGCGCGRGSKCQCWSAESLRVWAEEISEMAKAALSKGQVQT